MSAYYCSSRVTHHQLLLVHVYKLIQRIQVSIIHHHQGDGRTSASITRVMEELLLLSLLLNLYTY